MTELIILGSAAGVPTGNRHNSSIAIKKNGKLYVLDCGCPVSTLLKKIGEDPTNIEALFLTHWHPDHASGLPMLIQDLQLTWKPQQLTVYGPPSTQRKMRQLQNIFMIPTDVYQLDLTVHEYTEETVYQDDELTIRFFKTKHLAQDNWRKIDERHNYEISPIAFGFVIELDGQKIVFSGDILTSDDLITVLSGADLLIHEFGHIDPKKLNHFARQHGISKLLITHIHHEWDQHSDELKNIVSEDFAGEVIVAHDLMRISL